MVVLAFLAVPRVPESIPHFCLFRELFHIPCPGCGVLHGLAFLFRGSVGQAWQSNPGCFEVAALLGFQLIARPIALVSPAKAGVINSISAAGSRVALAVLFVVWTIRVIGR